MILRKSLFVFSLTALACLPQLESQAALEIVEPAALCDRFEKKADEKKCLNFVNTKKPDTYVSSTCQSLDDNKLFMQCLEFATKAEIDPRELESCAVEEMSDQERMSCLRKTADKKGSKFQRLPAQFSEPRGPAPKSSGKKR